MADPVDPPKAPKREIKPLNEEQVKRLLKAADGDKLEALYVLAITTGMRSGELLGLQWKDLDLPAGIVQVRRTVFNGRIEAPKIAKGNRSIKLTETSIRALREHERTSEWVFCTNAGLEVDPLLVQHHPGAQSVGSLLSVVELWFHQISSPAVAL